MDGTVLVADDDRTIRTVLTQAFIRAGCKVHATSSLVTLMRWIEEGKGDLVITDVVMPDGDGLACVPRIAILRPGLPVIVISAQNTIMTAIRAAKVEAHDYVPKPFDLPDLMQRAARALGARPTKARALGARPTKARALGARPTKGRVGLPDGQIGDPTTGAATGATTTEALPMVGHTVQMQAIYQLLARIMNAPMTALISGESGAGKSLIARAIHDFSDRRALPMVVIGAGDLGVPGGAVACLARAKGGTVVIDEVADIDLETQGRLVRALDGLDDRGPRILATTCADLAAQMSAGAFRDDLFYRLSGVLVHVPPLRDRVDDIPLLVTYFLDQDRARDTRDGLGVPTFSKTAMALMRSYGWPGNVRQLENVVCRLLVARTGAEIRSTEVETVLHAQPESSVFHRGHDDERLAASVERHLQRYFDLHGTALPAPGLYQRILREIERPLIDLSLAATGGNQARCADLLGINRNTLRKKIFGLDIEVTRRRKLM